MADVERTIQILFGAKDSASTVIRDVSKNLDQIADSVTGLTQPLADAHDKILKMEAALAILAAGGIAYAFKESSKLQTAFTELKKVVGDNAEDLDTAKKNALELSYAYGESAASILSATANFVQAGFNVEDSMKLVKTGMDLVIAGGLDASLSSEILIAALKGFRAPAEDAGRLMDILNEVSNKYATNVEELGIGMSKISPIARIMGFSMEETAGLVTPIIEIFRSGDEAATALKTGLISLISEAGPVGDALASIGVNQKDANGELRSGKDILMDVSKAFLKLDENQKLLVTSQIVGVKQAAKMVEVFDNLGKTSEITAVAMGAAGSAAKEVAERLKDPEIAINRLITGFNNLAGAIGDEFKGAAVSAIDGLTHIFQVLKDGIDAGAFDPVLDALGVIFDDIASSFEAIAENLPEAFGKIDFSEFVKSIKDLSGEVGDLIENIFGADLSTAEGLQKAIQLVVNGVTTLTNVTIGIIESWQKWAGWLGEVIDYLADTDAETAKNIGSFLQWGKVINEIAGTALSGLASGLSTLASLMIVTGGNIKSLLPIMASIVSTTASWTLALAGPGALVAAAGAVGYAVGTLIDKISNLVPGVKEAKEAVIGWIDSLIDFTGQQEQAAQYTNTMAGAVQKYKENMDAFPDTLDDLRASLADIGKAVDELPREVVLQMAFDEGLVTPERLLQIAASARETAADADPIEFPLAIDQDEADAQTAAWIADTQRMAKEADVVIEPEVKPPPDLTEEFKASMSVLNTLVEGFYDTIQSKIEWEAKLEIAEIEAGAKKIEAIMESVGASATGAADVLSAIFGNIGDARKIADRYTIQDWIDEQIQIQKEAMEIQKNIADAEINYLEARTKLLNSGKPLITVTGDGLQPHLEGFMWEIFKAVQTRISEEGLNPLLGV